jgi:hypothetical protein
VKRYKARRLSSHKDDIDDLGSVSELMRSVLSRFDLGPDATAGDLDPLTKSKEAIS